MLREPDQAVLLVRSLSFAYGDSPVISGCDLWVNAGEIVSLLGPSGCGKSTLLRIIAGLEHTQCGDVRFPQYETGSAGRFLGLLFQDYDAFPWLTVRENLLFGSVIGPGVTVEAADELLARAGLAGFELRYPAELSSGMRKRLGLARCVVGHPRLLLLDEPFASLDIDTKYDMYDLVQQLNRETGTSMVLVTHDLSEAVLLADRVLVGTDRPLSVCREIRIDFPRPRRPDLMNEGTFLAAVQSLRRAVTSARRSWNRV